MDNDLMARRLRPPSEPVHEASFAAAEESATALQSADQPQPEWPTADWSTADWSTPEWPTADWPTTDGSIADEAVTDQAGAAEDATANETVADQAAVETATAEIASEEQTAELLEAPWEFESADSSDAAWAEPVSEQAAPDETAAEAQADSDAPWAESATDAPWDDAATEAPWAHAATEAPWADMTNDQAPWAETASAEAPWTAPPDGEAPWDRPADAPPHGDTYVPDRPAWDQPADEPWQLAASLATPDQVAATTDPDDALAPVLADVDQAVASLWPSLNGHNAEDQDVAAWPEVGDGHEQFAADVAEMADAPETADMPETADRLDAPADTSEDVSTVSEDVSTVSEDVSTVSEDVSAMDVDRPAPDTDEASAADYDPTADFTLFGGDEGEAFTQPTAETVQADVAAAEAPEANDEVAPRQPADAVEGPTPPPDLFAPDEETGEELPVSEEHVAEAQEPAPAAPEPEAQEPAMLEPPTPAPMLVPMVTTASATTSPDNPGNLVVRIELTFVEPTVQVQPVATQSAHEDRAQGEASEGSEGQSEATARPEANGTWVEPEDAWADGVDEWTSPRASAGASIQAVAAPAPAETEAQVPAATATTADGQSAPPAEPDPAAAASLGGTLDPGWPTGDPLSRVPAASIEGRVRTPGVPALAAAMSVGPATTPAIRGPGQWFLPPKRKVVAAGAGGQQVAQVTQSSPLVTAALTVGMAVLVVVLVLVFLLFMTSVLH
jgi:hypothetical protein